jgi:hypothetical protein
MASDGFGTEINLFQGNAVHVSHGTYSVPPALMLFAARDPVAIVETEHASRFDAYLSALQHVAGML